MTFDPLEILELFDSFDQVDNFKRLGGYQMLRASRPSDYRKSRPRRIRKPYGIRHRSDCPAKDGSLIRKHAGKRRRCLGCVRAARAARSRRWMFRRCAVCDRPFAPPINQPKTCSKVCRYQLMAATKSAVREAFALIGCAP